jgi:hypothetical protein
MMRRTTATQETAADVRDHLDQLAELLRTVWGRERSGREEDRTAALAAAATRYGRR